MDIPRRLEMGVLVPLSPYIPEEVFGNLTECFFQKDSLGPSIGMPMVKWHIPDSFFIALDTPSILKEHAVCACRTESLNMILCESSHNRMDIGMH
jgi:hypothetical protein